MVHEGCGLWPENSVFQCVYEHEFHLSWPEGPILWPLIFRLNYEISFAHTSFKWANLAAHNAGVAVAIIGIAPISERPKILFSNGADGKMIRQESEYINAYLACGKNIIVNPISKIQDNRGLM